MRWMSSIGGLIATGAAVAVLVSLPTGTPQSEPVGPPIEESVSLESPATDIVIEQPVERDLSVSDLGDGITDVLAQSGYTQFVNSSELSETLPDSVVQVLIAEEAVLVIPSDSEEDG